MEAIRIENLKSLKDTKDIPLKDINLLVGPNSSGKSTLIRFFPLLKQSVEVKTRGPILWYGDYVDFGDYHTAVRKGAKEIVFHFDIKVDGSKGRGLHFYNRNPNFIADKNVHLKMFIKDWNDSTYVDKLVIIFNDQTIEIDYSTKGKVESLKVNESDFTEFCDSLRTFYSVIGLFPKIREYSRTDEVFEVINSYYFQEFLFFKQLFEKFRSKNRKNTSENTLRRLILRFGIGSKDEVLSNIFEITSNLKYWYKQILHWDVNNEEFQEFNDLLVASRTAYILDYIEGYLSDSILNFSYVAPLRATAQRYYRRQDLAITEVDFQGQNLAMFIDNMTEKTLVLFQDWVSKYFGFYPYTKSSEGHISLRIIDTDTKEDYNIADRGFGYSQILPVITLLWSVVTNKISTLRHRGNNKTRVLAIEQPELHLHPSLQSQLTKAFLAAIALAKERGIVLKLIIETHSQTIVNTLGHQIAENNFSPSNVSLVLFENSSSQNCSSINLAYYNEEGFLENWPIGFFEPQN